MKVTAFYKVFNEVDFIWESLESIYNFADEIIIFEYCLESMRRIIRPDRVTEHGLSTDGTTEAVLEFPDPDRKIVHCPVGFIYGAESIPYQMIADRLDVGEYAWVIDGDIVYSEKMASNIRRWIDQAYYDVIWIPERVFYKDLYHEKTQFYTHHQRIFRKPDRTAFYFPTCFEAHWIGPSKDLRWYERDEPFTWDTEHKYHSLMAADTEHGNVYHYALVRDVQKILEKLLWQYEMIDRRWNTEREREGCRNFRDPLEFKLKTHCWFLAHEPQHRQPWLNGQPEVMNGNRWMDYHWDEKPMNITYEEARELIGDPGEA